MSGRPTRHPRTTGENAEHGRRRHREDKGDAQRRRKREKPPSYTSNQGETIQDGTKEPTDVAKQFPNYGYGPDRTFLGFLLLFVELLTMIFLAVVVFSAPNAMSGGAAVLKSGTEYVGLLRKCTDTSCEDWMGGSSTTSSTTTSASTKQISSRAGSSSSFDYATFYLTTGLASLVSFWLSLYILLLTFSRVIRGAPKGTEKIIWDGIKRFAYRAARMFLIVQCILIPAVLLDIVFKSQQYKSSSGSGNSSVVIGTGVGFIFMAWLFVLLCTLTETRTPGGRTHRILMKLSCGKSWNCMSSWGCRGCCGGCGSCCSCCSSEDALSSAEKGKGDSYPMEDRKRRDQGSSDPRRQRPRGRQL